MLIHFICSGFPALKGKAWSCEYSTIKYHYSVSEHFSMCVKINVSLQRGHLIYFLSLFKTVSHLSVFCFLNLILKLVIAFLYKRVLCMCLY